MERGNNSLEKIIWQMLRRPETGMVLNDRYISCRFGLM
jgi:hypothetical protein